MLREYKRDLQWTPNDIILFFRTLFFSRTDIPDYRFCFAPYITFCQAIYIIPKTFRTKLNPRASPRKREKGRRQSFSL